MRRHISWHVGNNDVGAAATLAISPAIGRSANAISSSYDTRARVSDPRVAIRSAGPLLARRSVEVRCSFELTSAGWISASTRAARSVQAIDARYAYARCDIRVRMRDDRANARGYERTFETCASTTPDISLTARGREPPLAAAHEPCTSRGADQRIAPRSDRRARLAR